MELQQKTMAHPTNEDPPLSLPSNDASSISLNVNIIDTVLQTTAMLDKLESNATNNGSYQQKFDPYLLFDENETMLYALFVKAIEPYFLLENYFYW